MDISVDNNKMIIEGDVELNELNDLTEYFNKLTHSTERNIEIDFHNMRRMKSPLIAKLLILNQSLNKIGKNLSIKTNNTDIYEIFFVLKLQNIINIKKYDN